MRLDAFLASSVLLLSAATVASNVPRAFIPELGEMIGSITHSQWAKKAIAQYQGIPYAEPPVGDLRFKPPRPSRPWKGVLNATYFHRKCPMAGVDSQDTFPPIDDPGDIEDCLTLNVYTPIIPTGVLEDGKLGVMVYFHGGSFRVGSAQDFAPNFLLDYEVVLVVPQYRLGPLGFLSLQTDDIPGNVGLMDMVLVLEWTQKYIKYFGGDHTMITIFGQSAGGAAVTLMMVSPMVRPDMFRSVIVQSGSALGTWVMDPDPVPHARSIAKRINCTQEDLEELAKCLRNASAEDLLHAHSAFLSHDLKVGGRGIGGNHAVIQSESLKPFNKFLTEDPVRCFEEGRFSHKPMMAGVTKHEGSFILGNIYDIIIHARDLQNDYNYLSQNLTKDTLDFAGIADPTGMVTHILTEKYFGNGELGNFTKMIPGLIDICGVALLKAATFRVAQLNSRVKSTYMYTFNFQGNNTMFGYGEEVDYPFPGGVAHSDELIYLFPHSDKELSPAELDMAKIVTELWISFAFKRNPSAKGTDWWPPVSHERGPYLRISDVPTIRDNFFDEYIIAVTEGLADSVTKCVPNVYIILLTVFNSVFIITEMLF